MNVLSLNLFQLIMLVVVSGLVICSTVALIRGSSGRRDQLIWLVIWLATGAAVLWPGITSKVARMLGIGRGADLVFYCATFVLICGIWMLYARLRQVRREITLLVRHIAILEAERDLAADNTMPPTSTPDGKSRPPQ